MNATQDPVCIPSRASNDIFVEHCSLEDRRGEWPELEQFWDGEKQRLQDPDGQTRPLSSSPEKHLLHDDFIKEPVTEKEIVQKTDLRTIRGDEIKDIPTSYVIEGFKPHELIVIGTHVDKNIIPGFQYKVRKNLKEEYLFDGRALYLESIGLGYGKRLTFQGNSLNENNNYFWSDSQIHSFAFIFQALNVDNVFTIQDTSINQKIGRVIITNPALSANLELETIVLEDGRIEKKVKVHFSCDVIINDSSNRQNIFVEEVEAEGVAVIVRNEPLSKAKVEEIKLQNFIKDNCQLLLEE